MKNFGVGVGLGVGLLLILFSGVSGNVSECHTCDLNFGTGDACEKTYVKACEEELKELTDGWQVVCYEDKAGSTVINKGCKLVEESKAQSAACTKEGKYDRCFCTRDKCFDSINDNTSGASRHPQFPYDFGTMFSIVFWGIWA